MQKWLGRGGLIAAIGVRPTTATVTPPSGWTLVRRTDSNNNNSLVVYRKAAGSSEPTSYAWQLTGAGHAAGGIQAFSGVDTTNPIDVENGQATASALTHATPSVTTSVDLHRLLEFRRQLGRCLLISVRCQ